MTDLKNSPSETHTKLLLDSLHAHIAIINREGTIIETNTAWKSFSDQEASIMRSGVGTNYFTVLQKSVELGNDFALKYILGLKNVLNGKKESFSMTYSMQSSTNSYWFKLNVRPCNEDGQQFMMIHEDISSSMKARYQQKEKNDRYQVKFEQSSEGILITDGNGDILDANPAASDILGWTHAQILDSDMKSILNVEDPTYRDALQERDKRDTYQLEMDIFHKNGSVIPTEISSRLYRNPEGKLRALVSFRDISRRKEVEQDLIKTEHFTKSALGSIPGIFFVLDRNMNLVRWNENMVTNLGYTADELSSKKALDFIVNERKSSVRKKIKQCIETGEVSTETKMNSKERGVRDYFIHAKRFTEEGNVYIVGTGIDITENKAVELENQKNQLMMEQLFENAPVGIAIVDTDNNIRQINESFEEIFEYDKTEVTGRNINKLLAPTGKQDEAEAMSFATKEGQSLQTETVRLTKNEEEVPVLVGSVPVKMNSKTIALYGIYVDISHQHEYQQKLKHALHEKETLLAELHHRVKNNLALINSLLELQLFNTENPELKEEFENIQNRIMTIASIHEVLYQNGNLTRIPFDNFLQEIVSTASSKKQTDTLNFNIQTGDSVSLDINQSIPCGLLLNELLALIATNESGCNTDVNIKLREYGKKVHLILEGENFINNPLELRNKSSLHNILVETLVMQLNGTLIWPNDSGDYQKFELMFTKESIHSPAKKLIEDT